MSHSAAASNRDDLACALQPGEMRDRLAQWRALAVEAVGRVGEPGRVSSRYPRKPNIATRLEALIKAESECCPFLEFTVTNDGDFIEVAVHYPPEFEQMVAMIVPVDA